MSMMISNGLLEKLETGKYKPIVDFINEDDTLELRFKGTKVSVYYRGLSLASIDEDRIDMSKSFRKGRFIVELKDDLMKVIPYLKQNADFKFAKSSGTYETEFSQLISRENNSKKLGNVSDYFVIEEEYELEYNDNIVGGGRMDMVGLHIPHNSGSRKSDTIAQSKYGLVMIETKYLNGAYSDKPSTPGIPKHVTDMARVVEPQNQVTLDDTAHDLEEIYAAKRKLGFFPGLNGKVDSISISRNPEDMELILALIGHNTHSGESDRGEDLIGILDEMIKKYPKRITDRIYVAQSSEIGFGLYDKRMIKIVDYVNKMKTHDKMNEETEI